MIDMEIKNVRNTQTDENLLRDALDIEYSWIPRVGGNGANIYLDKRQVEESVTRHVEELNLKLNMSREYMAVNWLEVYLSECEFESEHLGRYTVRIFKA